MVPMNFAEYQVIRRNGEVAPFNVEKIKIAIHKAFVAVEGEAARGADHVRVAIEALSAAVIHEIAKARPNGGAIAIEDIQDQVEKALMIQGHHGIAKRYILYREEHAAQRAAKKALNLPSEQTIHVVHHGISKPLDIQALQNLLEEAAFELKEIDIAYIIKDVFRNLHDGVQFVQVLNCVILSARTKIEESPEYSSFAARILLHILRDEALGREVLPKQSQQIYQNSFIDYLQKGVAHELLDPRVLDFNIEQLSAALDASRDLNFDYLGLQTLYDRYFIHHEGQRFELPQWFFMRVAMGLSLNEDDKNARAIEFYHLLSQFYFMSSTPTLFNSATMRSQLSSCYLSTIPDDLEGIYEGLKENALLSKFAGGLGNDWTPVRALGSWIKGTNGKSQGVIPFLKVVNDTAVAVNQGGKRKGAVCAYLETWHLDIEEFLELRKNTGDDRRRCHDMNSANWIPDLFMKRVMEKGAWTLFTPSETPDLHDLYGKAFEARYCEYEALADAGKIKLFKRITALDLWRKMLTMLFETGHPWITFKDPCNIRSPQQHVGVVHSSNLCTEITLNTNHEEIAVCNLGSVNLLKHLRKNPNAVDGKNQGYELDLAQLQKTIHTAMRMLDNVIDINYYAVEKARVSNQRHRPVGLGLMGFQDCLQKMHIPYASDDALEFADASTEAVCYYAYQASSELATQRGVYSTYQGSLWSQGILPLDSLQKLADERGGYLEYNKTTRLDWDGLRQTIQKQGMRNSNCVAIAPTATISNIIGVAASIEPTYQNLYVKSNLSGEFTVINHHLVSSLKSLGLWDAAMIADIKYFDGSLNAISRIPEHIKKVYATAFEMDASWLVHAAARRQKWLDQAQSLNIYLAGASGKKLDEIYKLAWTTGLKTTYYLRTMGATHAEKSTIHTGQLNAVAVNTDVASNLKPSTSTSNSISTSTGTDANFEINEGAACYLKPGDAGFEECEACQ